MRVLNPNVTTQFFIYGAGMLLIVIGGLEYSLLHKKINKIGSNVKVLFILILIWHLFIVFHDFKWNYSNARKMFVDQYTFWPYLIIFLMPFGSDIRVINKLFKLLRYFKYIWLLSIPYFLLNPDLFSIAQDFFWMFGYGAGVLLILGKENRIDKFLSLLSILGALIVFLVTARRSMILICLYTLLFYLLKTVSAKKKRYNKISFLIIGVVFFLGLYFVVFNTTYFDLFRLRVDQNSRETVYAFFFNDMAKSGWSLFGKGMFGTYYAPLGYINTSPYRSTIETGYLHLILKGGCIELILVVSILIISIRKALFKSKNRLVKYSGLLLFGWLLDMAAFGLPAGNLMYMFIWIYIGIINSSICNWPEAIFSVRLKSLKNESIMADKYSLAGKKIRS